MSLGAIHSNLFIDCIEQLILHLTDFHSMSGGKQTLATLRVYLKTITKLLDPDIIPIQLLGHTAIRWITALCVILQANHTDTCSSGGADRYESNYKIDISCPAASLCDMEITASLNHVCPGGCCPDSALTLSHFIPDPLSPTYMSVYVSI